MAPGLAVPRVFIFVVSEVEHPGDESDAVAAIARAGCKNVKVLRRPTYGDDDAGESIVVEVSWPGTSAELRAALELEEVCV